MGKKCEIYPGKIYDEFYGLAPSVKAERKDYYQTMQWRATRKVSDASTRFCNEGLRANETSKIPVKSYSRKTDRHNIKSEQV